MIQVVKTFSTHVQIKIRKQFNNRRGLIKVRRQNKASKAFAKSYIMAASS
jgi:hypothetical protein